MFLLTHNVVTTVDSRLDKEIEETFLLVAACVSQIVLGLLTPMQAALKKLPLSSDSHGHAHAAVRPKGQM